MNNKERSDQERARAAARALGGQRAFTAADELSDADLTKLAGIQEGATANSTDAVLLARANHTGTQLLSTISDVSISPSNLNSLDDGVNSTLHFHNTDRDRANHTGTQLAATISDFAATVLATVLTGLSLATGTAITAADTVLSAMGKLQKQITDNLSTLTTHIANVANPHAVTKTQVGLGNADNTSDADKPVSTATQTALNLKADAANSALTGTTAANVINLTGGQIAFPAVQSASANVNTLDDYEEGTFTPTIAGATTAGLGTYTSQVGTYTKIGNMVFFSMFVVWTAHTGTGGILVSALPFTSSAAASSFNAVTVWISALTLAANSVAQGYVETGSTFVRLNQYTVGGSAQTAVAMDTAATVLITGSYRV